MRLCFQLVRLWLQLLAYIMAQLDYLAHTQLQAVQRGQITLHLADRQP